MVCMFAIQFIEMENKTPEITKLESQISAIEIAIKKQIEFPRPTVNIFALINKKKRLTKTLEGIKNFQWLAK